MCQEGSELRAAVCHLHDSWPTNPELSGFSLVRVNNLAIIVVLLNYPRLQIRKEQTDAADLGQGFTGRHEMGRCEASIEAYLSQETEILLTRRGLS